MPYQEIVPSSAAAAPAVSFGAPATGRQNARTFLQLRTRLRSETGNRSETDLTPEAINEAINEAYLDLATSGRFDELRDSYSFTTTAAQPLYTLPVGVHTIARVAITDSGDPEDGEPLRKMGMDSYRGFHTRDGRPTDVGREQGVLVLWPTPDGAYDVTVDIRIEPQPLSADSHQPILDPEWHPVIFYMAKALIHEGSGNYSEAQIAENRANKIAARKLGRAGDDDSKFAGVRPVRSRSELLRSRRS